jgi:hypothetical protein
MLGLWSGRHRPRARHSQKPVRPTRGEQKLVARTRRGDTGWDVSQSGFYDDNILCSAHEERLGRFDDYAFRFCRASEHGQPRGRYRLLSAMIAQSCSLAFPVRSSGGWPRLAQLRTAFQRRNLSDLQFLYHLARVRSAFDRAGVRLRVVCNP